MYNRQAFTHKQREGESRGREGEKEGEGGPGIMQRITLTD